MLTGINVDTMSGTIPELTFFAFQMTFFIITPALMVGAFVERMKFSAMLLFTTLWGILVYIPVCHMVWGGGTMFGLLNIADQPAIKDHAGGIVVHITAGVGALVAAIVLGPRKGYPTTAMPPHDLPMAVAGTGMLWVGWFGFNAGSGLVADGDSSMTLIVTHTSAATAALVWMLIEWVVNRKIESPVCLASPRARLQGSPQLRPHLVMLDPSAPSASGRAPEPSAGSFRSN